jgi:diguanylate cyclase (GGDEF)-like protein
VLTAPTLLDELADPRESVRVLLVEDDADDRELVREMLRDSGADVVLTACDRLSSALDPIARGLADLVLLDLSLPDATGLEGLRRLRVAAPELPIVVLSGLTDERVALEAVQAGAQDYLMKGQVDGVSLARAVRYAVERQRAERRLSRMALRDPLTGLPNRILFADRLEQALGRRARESQVQRLALMFVDLDGFKAVNDRFGHLTGDEVLVEVAHRLEQALRSADTIARLGGDEFTLLCEHVADADAAMTLARRIADSLAEPYRLPAGVARISAAVGVSLARPVNETADALLRRADAAMYAAKRGTGDRCALAHGDA